jgi:hypothetical protein
MSFARCTVNSLMCQVTVLVMQYFFVPERNISNVPSFGRRGNIGQGRFVQGTHRPRDALSKGAFSKDALSKGRIVQGTHSPRTHCPRDALSKGGILQGRIVQGTHCLGDVFSKGRNILSGIFVRGHIGRGYIVMALPEFYSSKGLVNSISFHACVIN